jgi:DHA2 family multidrug resistance protein
MRQAGASHTPPNKWVITSTVLLGSFVSVMDISIVNVATPQMLGTFGVSLDEITWVSVAYSIAEILLVTMAAGGARVWVASAIICCHLGSLRPPRCYVGRRAHWRR